MAWHDRHLLNARWPFSTSCAAAFCNIGVAALAAITVAATKIRFIPMRFLMWWVRRGEIGAAIKV
jgi:hypothetical protein